jgi:hypothetical protein
MKNTRIGTVSNNGEKQQINTDNYYFSLNKKNGASQVP